MTRVPLYQLSAQHGALLEAMEGDDDAAARFQYFDAFAEAWGRTMYGGMTQWCRERGVFSLFVRKVIVPEVRPLVAEPFRHVPVIDPEPPALVAVRIAVHRAAELSAARDSDRIERRKRGRPRTR